MATRLKSKTVAESVEGRRNERFMLHKIGLT